MTVSAGKNMETLKHSCTPSETVTWYSLMQNTLEIPSEVKLGVVAQAYNPSTHEDEAGGSRVQGWKHNDFEASVDYRDAVSKQKQKH